MKYINKILSLFVIALIATSCDPDAESYTPGELEDGNQGICFVGNYTQTVEVEPGITSFDLTLTRSLTDAAGTETCTGSSCSLFNFHSYRNRRIYFKEIGNCTIQVVSGTDRFPLQDSKIY